MSYRSTEYILLIDIGYILRSHLPLLWRLMMFPPAERTEPGRGRSVGRHATAIHYSSYRDTNLTPLCRRGTWEPRAPVASPASS